MIYYAQHQEDERLWCALSDIENGFYVDVGASYPEKDSVTKIFYDAGWHGINIEPSTEEYILLQTARPRDINIPMAAGAQPGIARFFKYPGWGLIVPNPSIRQPLEDKGLPGEEIDVPVISLTTLLTYNPPPKGEIHFLKIDVEGSEHDVLTGMDFYRDRPWIIVVEATQPHTQIRTDHLWNQILFENGYEFVLFDGLNSFYVRHESSDLIDHLALH